MVKEVISAKINTLSSSQKANLIDMLSLICGDEVGKMKYIPIDGFDIGAFSNRLLGSDENLYVTCLVDSIIILESRDTDDSIFLCNDDHAAVAKMLGVHIDGTYTLEDILTIWSSELLDSGIDDENLGYEESSYGDSDDEDEYEYSESSSEDSYEDESDYAESNYDVSDEESSYDNSVDEDDESKSNSEDDNVDISKRNSNEDELRLAIKRNFGTYIKVLVDKVKRRYNLLFESGYDLERPYGLLSDRGILYTDSTKNLKVRDIPDKDMDYITSSNLYEFIGVKVNCNISDSRSDESIGQDMVDGYLNGGNLTYFPYKLLEYAYGRNASNSNSTTYAYATMKDKSGNIVGVASDWSKFGEKVVEDVRLTIEDSITKYCLKVLCINLDYSDEEEILSILRNNSKDIQGFIDYVSDSLSVCMIITQYKSIDSLPVTLRLRVCDPSGKMGSVTTATIVNECFSGNLGGSEGSTLNSSLNTVDSNQSRVFEYNHEFNHKLSNAMPLFAYKAYEKLKEKGESVSYKNLILGQGNDGTILRNGTHGLNLNNNLFHYIFAGSRSGKGVMTLNILTGAILSNKAIFYLDNKPDTVAILSELAGGVTNGNENGPPFFCINGSNFEDDKQRQFTKIDNWIKKENIPIEAISLFGNDIVWSVYGEIFYLRALTLVLGIIFARGLEGGRAKMHDPEFNGDDGIFLVCDEINKVQTGFIKNIIANVANNIPSQSRNFKNMSKDLLSLYKEVNSENARKGSDKQLEKKIEEFQGAFNASKFYALSYLSTLADNISYIYNKKLAGFVPKEAMLSDIVVIGQDLDLIPITDNILSKAISSDRLSSDLFKGLGSTATAKAVSGDASIPLAHFVFKTADAIIGYNGDRQGYLCQGDKDSNAYGKLDQTARNFCYIPKFDLYIDDKRMPSSQLTKQLANDPTTVYFKPYLILNNSYNDYTETLYGELSKSGISKDDVIKEYPNDDGSDINPNVGFPEYISLMGVSDLPQRLKKSSTIANNIVGKYLGYPDDGSGRPLWLQFVTDLRPEWMFSIRDVACLCGGLTHDANLPKKENNPLTKEYYDYVKFLQEHSELGIVDSTLSFNSAFVADSDKKEYSGQEYESQARKEFYANDDCGDEETEKEECGKRFSNVFNDDNKGSSDDSTDNGSADTSVYGDEDVIDDMFGDDSKSSEKETGTTAFNDSSNDNVFNPRVSHKEVDEKDELISILISKLQENGIDIGDLHGYTVKEGHKGVDCNYSKPDSSTEFNQQEMGSMEFDETDENLEANTFANLINLVSSKVINAYGGYDRITSFRVVGGSIVVNGSVFRSKINKDCMGMLPLDIRRKINSGNLSELFNYRELLKMRNLRALEFDSTSFVYDYVSYELGYINTIGINNFFDDFKSLQLLVIGKNKFTRSNYKKEMRSDDIFYYQSKATKYSRMCDKGLSKVTSKSWNFTKNMFSSKNHCMVTKTLGVLFGGAASLVVGTATLGAKVTKHISQHADRKKRNNSIREGAKSGIKSFMEGLNGLFNE